MGLSIKKFIFLIVVFFIYPKGFGQKEFVLTKGRMTSELTVPKYEESSYSVYVPISFDLNKKWPLIIGFDSQGDPSRLNSFFKTTAEELDFIIITSNFSKKDKIKDKVQYITDFLNHILTLFPIDRRRIYVVGKGKDAVLTSALPIIFKEFDGVVALGDSFTYLDNEKVRKNFYYAATSSEESHNYLGLLAIRKNLKLKAIPAELYVYPDRKSFPDPKLITKIFRSYRIRNMVNGKIPKDSLWIKKSYDDNLVEVKKLKEEKHYLKARRELGKMRSIYRHALDTKPLKKEQQQISKIREYKKQRNQWRKYSAKERWWRNEFAFAIQEDLALYRFKNLGWWQFNIGEIKKAKSSDKKEEVKMALRMQSYLTKLFEVIAGQLSTTKEISLDKVLFLEVLKTLHNPQDYNSYRNIISLAAKDDDFPTALFYLEEMLKNGYKDLEKLYNIEGTLALKLTKEYNNVVKKHLGMSKYYQYE